MLRRSGSCAGPDRPGIVGRIASSSRWATWGIMPIGALTGGILATALGVRTVLLIGAIGAWASVLAVMAFPLAEDTRLRVHKATNGHLSRLAGLPDGCFPTSTQLPLLGPQQR